MVTYRIALLMNVNMDSEILFHHPTSIMKMVQQKIIRDFLKSIYVFCFFPMACDACIVVNSVNINGPVGTFRALTRCSG